MQNKKAINEIQNLAKNKTNDNDAILRKLVVKKCVSFAVGLFQNTTYH